MTAKVKKYIQNLSDAIPSIKVSADTYEASGKTEEDLKKFKQTFEKYFDKDNCIDYMIFSDLTRNADGFRKNWQILTYNGIKWWICVYDCDQVFGADFHGYKTIPVLTDHISSDTLRPHGYIVKYYDMELCSRYKELADMGIASADNIFKLLKEWTMRIGTSFYEEEYKKWADSPCISDSIVNSQHWEVMLGEDGNPMYDTSETFDATTAYNVGDIVSFGIDSVMGYIKFKCIYPTVALDSNIPHTTSKYSPIKEFKHCDSIYRVHKWIDKNVENIDKVYKYNRI